MALTVVVQSVFEAQRQAGSPFGSNMQEIKRCRQEWLHTGLERAGVDWACQLTVYSTAIPSDANVIQFEVQLAYTHSFRSMACRLEPDSVIRWSVDRPVLSI
jgi:hypothetical protein